MKVTGIHTYLGGFALGIMRIPEVEFTGTIETWEDPVETSKRLGVPHINYIPDTTDVVISNPPCSRFSAMATGRYTRAEKSRLQSFPELWQTINLGIKSGSSVIWWETGPLAFNKGRDLIKDIHEYLDGIWNECTTVVSKMDLLHVGVPQRRLRTHVFHFKNGGKPVQFPEVDDRVFEVKDWVSASVGDLPMEPVSIFKDPRAWKDPVDYILNVQKIKFKARLPRVVDEADTHVSSILLDKDFAWRQENRWWSVNEYAAVMGYPMDQDYSALGSSKDIRTFLVKGVSPKISWWLMNYFVVKILDGFGHIDESKEIPPGFITYLDHKVDLKKHRVMYTQLGKKNF